MKKFLSIFSIAAVMVACNSNPKTTSADEARKVADSLRFAADTAGLAQYQAWKSQNELVNTTPYAQQNLAQNAAPVSSTTRRSSSTTRRSSNSGSMSSSSSNTAQATQKKGWSKAAKGAVIGGVVGGAAGAVINKKNRVAGGVIGGILGAGVGYGIGRGQDKKDGRY